ncbi:MAG: hypothetical protein KC964_24530 [Candidatus Omnitrophica bacterium]|nr:hypothetical protein [Candidatus Omnitrophota bacterium]
MKNKNRLFNIAVLPAFVATLAFLPGAFAQDTLPPTVATQLNPTLEAAPMGILKGRIVDEQTRQPMADIKVRLIGFQGEALTNARGEFFLEAPARQYAGLVMEFPETGQMRLFEEPIAMNAGQFLNLDQIALEPLIDKEPLDLPNPNQEPTQIALGETGNRPNGQDPATVQTMDGLAGPDRFQEAPDGIDLRELNGPNPGLTDPVGIDPTLEIHPTLLKARTMTANGNFYGAGRAYEDYLALFPNDGPVAVEYGVMVYHNIQNAQGRTILKEARTLPGLRPIDIDQISRYLIPTTIVVHEPERPSYARIRLRHRHFACH